MRLVLLGNFSTPHSTEQHHRQALEDLGHDVVCLQEGKATAGQVVSQARGSSFLVWVHTHGFKTPGGIVPALRELKRHGTPTIAYHLDLWMGLDREKDLTEGHPYLSDVSHFFTVDSRMADWLNSHTGVRGHYLTAAVAHRECYAWDGERDIPVAFVGSHHYHAAWPYRNELIARLADRYGDDFHLIPGRGPAVRGADLNRLYSRTQVVVGDTLCPGFDYPDYWSDRAYETLGRGGFLIHPRITGMKDQFVDGVHLRYYDYNDWDSLFGLVDYYLANPEHREEIRATGHAEVHAYHTYIHRWKTILETLR